MSLKSFIRDIQELKGGIGSMSRRSIEVRSAHHRSRSQVFTSSEVEQQQQLQQAQKCGDQRQEGDESSCCWASMPAELLRDIVQRLESSEAAWPQRKHVVACSAVCSAWRDVTKEIVQPPELSGKITFPASLKQPGPRETPVQCYIKRDRTTATYRLYLGLSPTLMENGKFLLAARKFRRATSTDYIISIDPDDMSRGSSNCVGKLRSNFLGTKFAIYDSQPPRNGAVASTNKGGRRVAAKQVSPQVPAGSYNVAHISYELNVLGTRGPRRMQCTLNTVTGSSQLSGHMDDHLTVVSSPSSKLPSSVPEDVSSIGIGGGDPLVLKNKSPRWHEQLQCWCLNFRGRVTVASVKNFQLVAAAAPGEQQPVAVAEQDKVLLQFGKIGKDMFTMDYRYPLSAFQAFAICLSSFDTKLACE